MVMARPQHHHHSRVTGNRESLQTQSWSPDHHVHPQTAVSEHCHTDGDGDGDGEGGDAEGTLKFCKRSLKLSKS